MGKWKCTYFNKTGETESFQSIIDQTRLDDEIHARHNLVVALEE
jgi:hypothetical protein